MEAFNTQTAYTVVIYGWPEMNEIDRRTVTGLREARELAETMLSAWMNPTDRISWTPANIRMGAQPIAYDGEPIDVIAIIQETP